MRYRQVLLVGLLGDARIWNPEIMLEGLHLSEEFGYTVPIKIQFIDSMNLCGFLMDLLGLRLGPLCCMSLTGPGTVFRLCLESVHLSFTNFLFLQCIPPALVCTLYVHLLITSIIMALAQFLAFWALIECRLHLQSLIWVDLLNSCCSVLLVVLHLLHHSPMSLYVFWLL